MQKPDWEELARSFHLISERNGGRQEFGGSSSARDALATILGPEVLREAVDHYVSGRPGSELARSVLWLLRPAPAMERCFEIFREESDLELRRSAVELLRVVADRRVLPWIDQFLSDPDEGIQERGFGIVDQLTFSELIEPEESLAILDQVASHPNSRVREIALEIRESLAEIEDAVQQAPAPDGVLAELRAVSAAQTPSSFERRARLSSSGVELDPLEGAPPAISAGDGPLRYAASRAPSMYLRFTIQKEDPDSKRKTGLLVAAAGIRDEADLSVDEHATVREALDWFNDHLEVPAVLREAGTERAISWFKSDAKKPLAHMWALAEIVERYGYVVEFHKTKDPGEILYEDGWQIVARPSKGSKTSR